MISIGITGSWGKTTTKEQLWRILKMKRYTQKTIGNQNTVLGISKQILKIPPGTKIFICEMGAYKRGEIKEICQLVKPKIGIITAIGPMHLERFVSIENIKRAKLELIGSLPEEGFGFIPMELKQFAQSEYSFKCKKIIAFRKSAEVIDKISKYFGLDIKKINKIISETKTPEHRREINKGKIITVIDDSYNSNPKGFKLAVDLLSKEKAKVKIIVTPGMIELGELSYKENYEAAKYASKRCTHAIIVGETNKKALAEGLKINKKMKLYFANNQQKINEFLQEIVVPQNTALLIENDLPDNYF